MSNAERCAKTHGFADASGSELRGAEYRGHPGRGAERDRERHGDALDIPGRERGRARAGELAGGSVAVLMADSDPTIWPAIRHAVGCASATELCAHQLSRSISYESFRTEPDQISEHGLHHNQATEAPIQFRIGPCFLWEPGSAVLPLEEFLTEPLQRSAGIRFDFSTPRRLVCAGKSQSL